MTAENTSRRRIYAHIGSAIVTILGALLVLCFLGLAQWGLHWVYYEGPFWLKILVSGCLFVFVFAVISFVKYLFESSSAKD